MVAGWVAIGLMIVIGIWYGFRLKNKKNKNK